MTDIITTAGKNVILNRGYKSTPDYTVPSQFKVGISQGTPLAADTELDVPIPILDGTTNDDGSNTMTGAGAGTNSTDNTTTFKEGGGNTDVTAQNLIKDNSAVEAYWIIAALTANGTAAQPIGFWLYVKDATALAKLKSSSTCVQYRIGSDTNNFYYQNFTISSFAVGWNWVTSNTTNIEDLSEAGTVTGNINTFVIQITTNNATDEFAAGDIVYDLLRQWEYADTVQNFVSGYPTFDEVNNKVTIRGYLNSTLANGFLINASALVNTDSSILMTDISDFDGQSKSDTDEFAFVFVNQLAQG